MEICLIRYVCWYVRGRCLTILNSLSLDFNISFSWLLEIRCCSSFTCIAPKYHNSIESVNNESKASGNMATIIFHGFFVWLFINSKSFFHFDDCNAKCQTMWIVFWYHFQSFPNRFLFVRIISACLIGNTKPQRGLAKPQANKDRIYDELEYNGMEMADFPSNLRFHSSRPPKYSSFFLRLDSTYFW